MPIRIQRKRTKGWKMPEGAVYVGRPTKWGNPWKVGEVFGYDGSTPIVADAVDCVGLFRLYALDPADPLPVHELRGKDLACFCPLVDRHGNYSPCHADVLLELAND